MLAPPERAAAPHELAPSALRGRRVLIVDDNDINRLIASEMLQLLGLQPLQARHGQEALDLLHAGPMPDGVLMDCHMPVMDGYEATRRIRLQPQWQALPVIAMTADSMAEDRVACLAAGMNDHLAKPILVDTLRSVLLRWLASAAPSAPGTGA